MAQLLWGPRLSCFLLFHLGFLPGIYVRNQEKLQSCFLGSQGLGNAGWSTEGWPRWLSARSSLEVCMQLLCPYHSNPYCLLVFDRASEQSRLGHPRFI